jgi:nickel-dependent lactate racemase
MVLGIDRNAIDAFSGPIDTTFETATKIARECFSAPIQTKADVVVTVSRPPFDVNLYQTLKAIEHGKLALNEGGTLIVVSPCPQGLGPDSFARLFTERDSMAHAVEHSKAHYRLGDHNAVNLVTLVKQGRLFAITDIDSRVLENAGITPRRTLERAIEQASVTKGRPVNMLILMNGALTVPVVGKTA